MSKIVWPKEAPKPEVEQKLIDDDVSIDNVLTIQRTALMRLTKQISIAITAGDITKETPNQLATCIKIALELRDRQEELSDEEIEKIASR